MASYNRFLLVILRGMLEDDKICLPENAVIKFGAKIPNRVVFKLPDSMEWEILVSKSEEMIWFHGGWREFKEYYLLEYGSLLTLKFDGKSAFKVRIYDKTAYEIDYLRARKTSENDEFKEKDSIELKPDLLVETRGKSSLHDPPPFKKVKLEDPWTETAEFRDGGEDGDKLSSEVIPKSKSKKSLKKSISAIKKIQAFERTCSFKSDNPIFKIVVQSSYVSKLFNLYMPCKFTRKYLPMKQGDCTLKVADGRTWHASYRRDQLDRTTFVLGWKEFVLDNDLKVGDVCVFELIQIGQISFKVSIFPANNCQGSEKKRGRPPSQSVG